MFVSIIPKVDLLKFSGESSDWENLSDVFRSIMHCREDLLPIMKLHYLRTHLTGEAHEKIKSLAISSDKYVRVWATLIEYYENQRHVVGSHVAEIFSVKPIATD